MSRSRKKTPIIGHTKAESEKAFKQAEHQRERTAVRDALRTGSEILPAEKEFGNPWKGDKDGKQWLRGPDRDKWLRK